MFVPGNRCAAATLIVGVFLTGCAKREKLAASISPAPGKMHEQYRMRYVDVAIGTGKLAEAGKMFSVHYTGWLRDGTKFDSSREKKPLSFEQGKRKVIPGWDAGFEGMRVGGKRRLFIPYQLAYGEKGRGKIPPKAELIFDVELMDVTDPPPVAEARSDNRQSEKLSLRLHTI
jgi:peptidylprolyl isomerase